MLIDGKFAARLIQGNIAIRSEDGRTVSPGSCFMLEGKPVCVAFGLGEWRDGNPRFSHVGHAAVHQAMLFYGGDPDEPDMLHIFDVPNIGRVVPVVKPAIDSAERGVLAFLCRTPDVVQAVADSFAIVGKVDRSVLTGLLVRS